MDNKAIIGPQFPQLKKKHISWHIQMTKDLIKKN